MASRGASTCSCGLGSRRGKADLGQIRAIDARAGYVGKLTGKTMKAGETEGAGGSSREGRGHAAASTADAAARHTQGEGSAAATAEPAEERAKAATAATATLRAD